MTRLARRIRRPERLHERDLAEGLVRIVDSYRPPMCRAEASEHVGDRRCVVRSVGGSILWRFLGAGLGL